jgi:hypothetical protein
MQQLFRAARAEHTSITPIALLVRLTIASIELCHGSPQQFLEQIPSQASPATRLLVD